MPLSEWKRFYSETLRRPLEHDLYARREFFDIAPLSGSFRLLEQAQFHLTHELHASELALPLLANDTLSAMPPLTFFAGAVLDSEGHSYESLDLETAMLHPLANAARVFSLAKQRLSPAGTLARLETAALAFPAHAPHLRAAANAFRIALCYRALCAGNIIVPNELSKYDQLVLKGGFASIQRFLEFTADTFVAARP
jgi:signal-transduction protein with cAMP-binding, CBS, and nucleotidyltransferase domain